MRDRMHQFFTPFRFVIGGRLVLVDGIAERRTKGRMSQW